MKESTDEGIRTRLRMLVNRAERDRREFDNCEREPDPTVAMQYLQRGAGQAIALYIHGRTGGRFVHFSQDECSALEGAMNTWFSLYAACYDVELDADYSLRTAAEALIDTHNVKDVAQILTGIPPRE